MGENRWIHIYRAPQIFFIFFENNLGSKKTQRIWNNFVSKSIILREQCTCFLSWAKIDKFLMSADPSRNFLKIIWDPRLDRDVTMDECTTISCTLKLHLRFIISLTLSFLICSWAQAAPFQHERNECLVPHCPEWLSHPVWGGLVRWLPPLCGFMLSQGSHRQANLCRVLNCELASTSHSNKQWCFEYFFWWKENRIWRFRRKS